MSENSGVQIRHVYDRWRETIVRRDIDGRMALYAEDAIFESPAVLVTLRDRTRGILRGKSEFDYIFSNERHKSCFQLEYFSGFVVLVY